MLSRAAYGAWALGVAAFAGLIAWGGAGQVAAAFTQSGFGQVAVVTYHLVPITLDTLGWRALMPKPVRRPFAELLLFRWYGESVSALVPLGQVGGDLLRGQLHARTGVPGPTAIGIAVVDLAATVYAQMTFAALGLIGLGWIGRGPGGLVWRLGATLSVLAVLLFGFYLAQKKGMFARLVRVLEVVVSGESEKSRTYAETMDRTIRRLYRRGRPLAVSIGFHLLSWLFGAGEVWLAACPLEHSLQQFVTALRIVGKETGERAEIVAHGVKIVQLKCPAYVVHRVPLPFDQLIGREHACEHTAGTEPCPGLSQRVRDHTWYIAGR